MEQPATATAATDTADSEQSAVAKVFALPELLEHILFCLASEKLKAKVRGRVINDIQPLKCLAAVERVDTNFFNNIKSSKKLQRLMATPLVTKAGREDRVELFNEAIWLHMGDLGDWVVAIQEFDTSTEKGLRMFETLLSNKEASWRSVRTRKAWKEKIVFAIYAVRGQSYDLVGCSRWNLAGDATLGMLFDIYSEIMMPIYEKDRRMRSSRSVLSLE